MCISEIVLHPNLGLRTLARQVEDFNSEQVVNAIKCLTATMGAYEHCVGLAANQIDIELNIFVADASKNKRAKSEHGFVVVCNPEIVLLGDLISQREGCMSVPDLTGNVKRSSEVRVMGQDQNGNKIELRAFDFEARVFQHEVDHLNGKVFLDRVKSTRDVFARKQYRSPKSN